MTSLLNDMEGASAAEKYVYDAGRGTFWKEMRAEWIELREAAMRRELKKRGFKEKPDTGKHISEVDDLLRDIEQTERVRRAIEVAGWRVGVQRMGPDAILVPRAAPLIVAQEGQWLLTAAYLEGIFRGWEKHFLGEAGDETEDVLIDQRDHVYAWVQHWLRSLYAGSPTSGLGMHLAGLPECGKSRFAAWLKELSGGRVGKPYRYMIGRDDFNRELVEASLQLVDDEQADTTREARKEFASQWKMFTANEDFKMRGMHSDGFNIRACWRLLVLTNMQEAALQVMPAITADLKDKVLQAKGYTRRRLPVVGDEEGWARYRESYPALSAWWDYAVGAGLLKVEELAHCWPMPMPTGTPELQGRFWAQMRAEMSAFVFWLTSVYVAPSHVAGGRFGVRDWQHPDILAALQAFSPHVRFFQLIERSEVVWRKVVRGGDDDPDASLVTEPCDTWEGSSQQLEELLKSEASKLSPHEKIKEVPQAAYVGHRLTEAMEAWGEDVVKQLPRTRKGRSWLLRRRPDLLV